MVSFAVAFLLDLIMPTSVAFAIVGVLYGVGGYVLFGIPVNAHDPPGKRA